MNLTERKREEYRSRIMQRIGAVLVCMSLLLATVFPPQPAKAAFVADDMAVAAIAAVFLASCGMTFAAQGMDSSGVKDQVGVLIDQYLNTMMGGKSALEWFGDVAIGYNRGMMVLPSAIANKLADFARWVKGEYNVEAGEQISLLSNAVYVAELYDGSIFNISVVDHINGVTTGPGKFLSLGTEIEGLGVTRFKNGFEIKILENQQRIETPSGGFAVSVGKSGPLYYFAYDLTTQGLSVVHLGSNGKVYYDASLGIESSQIFLNNNCSSHSESMTIDSAEIFSIPDTIPADKEVAISTGAAATSYDDALAQILDAIAAGELSATKEIADAGTITDDPTIPIEETVPDVGELGLPALGETLTTRFPFSIPWDVVRAIKLLAAPAKTPRFEVDFFAPVRYRFGGKLGDTTVVLDFSEYEIIGQVSRWASTIGFCLLLASGTKKLIWTA